MLQFPSRTSGSLILPSLSLLILNPALLLTSRIKITLPNPLGNSSPQFPALPITLLSDGLDGHFLLGWGDIVECKALGSLGAGVPCTFDDQRGFGGFG